MAIGCVKAQNVIYRELLRIGTFGLVSWINQYVADVSFFRVFCVALRATGIFLLLFLDFLRLRLCCGFLRILLLLCLLLPLGLILHLRPERLLAMRGSNSKNRHDQ